MNSHEQLRNQLRSELPEEVVVMWDMIESICEMTIEVHRPSPSVTPRQAGSETSEKGAAIILPTHEPLCAAAAYHELLHIHRFWIEGVPQLVAKVAAPAMRQVAPMLDNDVEHSIIIPRQVEAAMNEPFFLQDQISKRWGGYPWPANTEVWRRRYMNFTGALYAPHLSAPHQETIARCLALEGATREASLFVKRMNDLSSDKPRMLACMIRFVKLRKEDFLLRYIDIRKRSTWVEEVPLY
ncbi:hypothetical protein [Brevundimonas sp.]|uniref:hypothetical protein n=1 Tax=Brevundimonas sp. TaxID=1871086 RepID=UPI0035B30A7B